jgi:hypothetical protein
MADQHEAFGIPAAASGDLERCLRSCPIEILGDLEG